MYRGEVPRTAFVDWFDAIEVELVNGPGPGIRRAMAEMQQASFSPSLSRARHRAHDALEAGTYASQPLSLNMEIPHFTFLISGVSRAMTHQIVRTRVGVTYAQKCTGDGDVRHDDVLVPRSLNRKGQEHVLAGYIAMNLAFKQWYAAAVDEGDQSIHVLRYAMPHGLSQYIYQSISLLALVQLYGKRTCPEQPPEWQVICEGYRRALDAHYPWAARMLKKNCPHCYLGRAGNNDPMIGRLYFPDVDHDREPWHPGSFVHQGTAEDVMGGPPFETVRYYGSEIVETVHG